MLQGALFGFGRVAEQAHAPTWEKRRDFRIVAVAEPVPERASLARRFFPTARLYPSPEELLRKETRLDFVDISTPPFLHASQTIRALRRGAHVLCEKPLALRLRDLERIRHLAAC